jgi:hypothetical protein
MMTKRMWYIAGIVLVTVVLVYFLLSLQVHTHGGPAPVFTP